MEESKENSSNRKIWVCYPEGYERPMIKTQSCYISKLQSVIREALEGNVTPTSAEQPINDGGNHSSDV